MRNISIVYMYSIVASIRQMAIDTPVLIDYDLCGAIEMCSYVESLPGDRDV